jgi:hypothetical protein
MSATQATVEQLLRDLCDLEDMHIGTGSRDGLFTTSHQAKHGPPHFFSLGEHGAYLGLDGEQWRLFAKLDAIQRVRFVRAPALTCARRPEDPQIAGEESLAVHLVGQNDHASLSFSFGRLYDEQDQPIAARFALWKELRAKYGGHDELWVGKDGRLAIPTGR